MGITTRRLGRGALSLATVLTLLAGCSSDSDDAATGDATTPEASVDPGGSGDPAPEGLTAKGCNGNDPKLVPQDFGTIQAAVDAAEECDLIIVDEGVYNEAVDVRTPDITIRGVDRNTVILDGEFELENGIRIADADGVVVENMTARNYTANGFFWTGSDRYRGSYLTAYRNGDYGIYAFDAYHGLLNDSLGSGSPDAGFYIGECFRCDAVIDNVISEYNGLGYSGTNSGGDLYIVNSTFRYNRSGIVPNSGAYELCYPNRETTIVGNIVHDNNNLDNPAISVALFAGGTGILVAGAVKNDIERNLVFDHDRWGIIGITLPEEDSADNPPPPEDDDLSCEEQKAKPPADPEDIPELVLWQSRENRIIGNVVENSGIADIGFGGFGPPLEELLNCFADNTFTTSEPPDIEAVAPCDAQGTDDWEGSTDTLLLAEAAEAPPEDRYKEMPVPEEQEAMPDALTADSTKFEAPERPDIDAITVPEKPEGA